tara:strand:+ start:366 stop:797 length:432 start_codon:yes stop_codon:yes gene_type:complete
MNIKWSIVLLFVVVLNVQSQTNKIEMEPKILLVGRNLTVMEILKKELLKYDRNIVYANSIELIELKLNKGDIDLVVIGAGIPDAIRNEMQGRITVLHPNTPLFMIKRTADGNPAKMIHFCNEKAIIWKIEKSIGPLSKSKYLL